MSAAHRFHLPCFDQSGEGRPVGLYAATDWPRARQIDAGPSVAQPLDFCFSLIFLSQLCFSLKVSPGLLMACAPPTRCGPSLLNQRENTTGTKMTVGLVNPPPIDHSKRCPLAQLAVPLMPAIHDNLVVFSTALLNPCSFASLRDLTLVGS
jgi:hypothetical protein